MGGGRLSALDLATAVWDPGPQRDLCGCFPGQTVGTRHIWQLAKGPSQRLSISTSRSSGDSISESHSELPMLTRISEPRCCLDAAASTIPRPGQTLRDTHGDTQHTQTHRLGAHTFKPVKDASFSLVIEEMTWPRYPAPSA